MDSGGGSGIRTHGRENPSLDFESSPFDHSGTPPRRNLSASTLRGNVGPHSLNPHRYAMFVSGVLPARAAATRIGDMFGLEQAVAPR